MVISAFPLSLCALQGLGDQDPWQLAGPKSQEIVCGLASDLWARIFSRLEDPNDCLGYQNKHPEHDQAEHAAFFQLRLVCRAFNQIFADYHLT